VHVQSPCVLTGGPDDVWIFEIGGTFNVDNGVSVTMAGGAQAKNVFWAVNGAVTLAPASHLDGVVLANGAISLGAGASSTGRLISNGTVSVDGSAVAQP
jgi:hypothetical protein